MRTRSSAIALITALLITQMPVQRVKAQAALVVPTGAAIVILGGISYYVWMNSQGYEERVPVYPVLADPEDEMERMGRPQSETVTAGTQARATELCEGLANGRTLQKVQWFESNRWECIFY